MDCVANDKRGARGSGSTASGFAFALASALSFGMAGALGRGLLDSGWSAGAAVTVRVLGAGVVLAPVAAWSLRGRWELLVYNWRLVVGYGALAVAATQLCYFYAVGEISAGVALLIEYTAPVLVVGWLWAVAGQRPGRLTVVGAVIALVGLGLVLDLGSGASVNLPGVLWSCGAMVGAAGYFLLAGAGGADPERQLPPLALATAGLGVGGAGLALAGVVGLLSMEWSTADVRFTVGAVPWWLPILVLCVVTAALAYSFGIAAVRRLGSRLASFVALTEVLATLLAAWWLLDQFPSGIQLVGGVLVLGGVVVVKLGESTDRPPRPPGHPAPQTDPRSAAHSAPTH